MKKIWKAVIHPNSIEDKVFACFYRGPVGSKPISVGLQNNNVCVWFECDTDSSEAVVQNELYCVGTGYGSVPEGCRFLGTVIDGGLVWHFYVPPTKG